MAHAPPLVLRGFHGSPHAHDGARCQRVDLRVDLQVGALLNELRRAARDAEAELAPFGRSLYEGRAIFLRVQEPDWCPAPKGVVLREVHIFNFLTCIALEELHEASRWHSHAPTHSRRQGSRQTGVGAHHSRHFGSHLSHAGHDCDSGEKMTARCEIHRERNDGGEMMEGRGNSWNLLS